MQIARAPENIQLDLHAQNDSPRSVFAATEGSTIHTFTLLTSLVVTTQ